MVRKVQAESVANNSDSLFNPSKKMRSSSQSDMDNEHSSFHSYS
jgi:hypothetical protein